MIPLQQMQDQQPQHTMAQPAAVQRLLPPGRSLLMPQPMPHLPGMRVQLRWVITSPSSSVAVVCDSMSASGQTWTLSCHLKSCANSHPGRLGHLHR